MYVGIANEMGRGYDYRRLWLKAKGLCLYLTKVDLNKVDFNFFQFFRGGLHDLITFGIGKETIGSDSNF